MVFSSGSLNAQSGLFLLELAYLDSNAKDHLQSLQEGREWRRRTCLQLSWICMQYLRHTYGRWMAFGLNDIHPPKFGTRRKYCVHCLYIHLFPTNFGQSTCNSVKLQPISTLRLPNHARTAAELPNRRNCLHYFRNACTVA